MNTRARMAADRKNARPKAVAQLSEITQHLSVPQLRELIALAEHAQSQQVSQSYDLVMDMASRRAMVLTPDALHHFQLRANAVDGRTALGAKMKADAEKMLQLIAIVKEYGLAITPVSP